jgi:hypothetical protein
VGVIVGVGLGLGVGVAEAVAVAVGVGIGPDCVQYLPPVSVTIFDVSTIPPQTIISPLLQTAV